MKLEYSFSKGERGKFYNPNATMNFPVYLESEVLDYFAAKAKKKGIELDEFLNETLKKDISITRTSL